MQFRQLQQRIVRIDRFLFGDVERGGLDPVFGECFGQCRAVDDLPARRVDQQRRRLHQSQGVPVDQVVCLLRHRAVDRHVVGLGQQLLKRHDLDAVQVGRDLVDVRVGGNDPGRPEAADAGGEGAADVAEADDADGVAGDPPGAGEEPDHRFPMSPAPIAGRAGGVDHAPRQREHQRHRVVGHLGRVGTGHVGRQDAEFGGGVEIDRVDADPQPADHLELRAPLEHGARGQRHDADQGAVGVGQQVGGGRPRSGRHPPRPRSPVLPIRSRRLKGFRCIATFTFHSLSGSSGRGQTTGQSPPSRLMAVPVM